MGDVRHSRRHLLHGDDGRRLRLPRAATGLVAPSIGRRVDAGRSRSPCPRRPWLHERTSSGCSGLCSVLNVSAGIGILGIASPMVQEIFRGRVTASAAAGFAGLLSLFNIAGRIFWASLSDWIGRRATYGVFFALGALLYASAPVAGASGGLLLFVAIFCVALTMYGGGFAAIPAYLADLFGAVHVSAIHGRLLTAWSTAGVLGPVLVNYIREFQIGRGVAPGQAYTITMYILASLLVLGFFCNLAVKPVPQTLFVDQLTCHRRTCRRPHDRQRRHLCPAGAFRRASGAWWSSRGWPSASHSSGACGARCHLRGR